MVHPASGYFYQPLGDKGLIAIDKNSGRLLWQIDNGLDLLAQANGKAYVITNARTLIVMDNKQARKICEINFAAVSKYAANVDDSKNYIADTKGRIACLRPTE